MKNNSNNMGLIFTVNSGMALVQHITVLRKFGPTMHARHKPAIVRLLLPSQTLNVEREVSIRAHLLK